MQYVSLGTQTEAISPDSADLQRFAIAPILGFVPTTDGFFRNHPRVLGGGLS